MFRKQSSSGLCSVIVRSPPRTLTKSSQLHRDVRLTLQDFSGQTGTAASSKMSCIVPHSGSELCQSMLLLQAYRSCCFYVWQEPSAYCNLVRLQAFPPCDMKKRTYHNHLQSCNSSGDGTAAHAPLSLVNWKQYFHIEIRHIFVMFTSTCCIPNQHN